MSLISKERPLLLLGCGKMGYAMLTGWLESGIKADDIHVIDPNADAQQYLKPLNVHIHNHINDILLKPSILLLAVKPQTLDNIKNELISLVAPDSLVVSIAAGKNLLWLQSAFGDNQPIIRTMPNTPAQIKQAITALCANGNVNESQMLTAKTLLCSIGDVVIVDDESQMDAITALSGSGPAWVFLLTEAMEEAGIKQGLSPELAAKLARKTVEGAAALMANDPNISPAILRQNVTSPGGTTAAAMEILMGKGGWQNIIDTAMAASVKRSRELS
ncbi:MAG: pyrroline-5-carboxylate reductase [Alphaproteobacteria bacterium]